MPKIFAKEPFVLCFRTFPVTKKIINKRGVQEYQDFPSNVFCLGVPKTFVGEHFFAAYGKNCGSEKLSG